MAVAAVLVFWIVGAYNRLMALRNRIGSAWAEIEALRRRRAEVAEALLTALRGPLAAEQGALEGFAAAHRQAAAAAERVSAAPMAAPAALAFARADAELAAAASRLLALAAQTGDEASAAPAAAWAGTGDQLRFARGVFDTAVADYNAALAQAPTRWLRRVFGFSAAAPLG
jgi:LemA protein